jgi:hypothetical protein
MKSFEFLLSMTIWYDILITINTVSKNLQSKDIHIDVAIDQLEDLIAYFKTYRETGFVFVIISSKEIATIIEIEHVFREKHVSHRKKQFDEDANDETTQSVEESFRIDYFLIHSRSSYIFNSK